MRAKGAPPTRRQLKLAARLARNMSEGIIEAPAVAARAAGFAASTANAITNTIKSKSFQDLLEQFLPDHKILKAHSELITTENEAVRLGSIKLAYQVKGKLDADNTMNPTVNIAFLNEPDQASPMMILDSSKKYVDVLESGRPVDI